MLVRSLVMGVVLLVMSAAIGTAPALADEPSGAPTAEQSQEMAGALAGSHLEGNVYFYQGYSWPQIWYDQPTVQVMTLGQAALYVATHGAYPAHHSYTVGSPTAAFQHVFNRLR